MNRNFKIGLYITVEDVKRMAQEDHLPSRMAIFDDHLHIDRVYLETFRSGIMATSAELVRAKQLWAPRGVRISGGITTTRPDKEFWCLLCYTRPEDVALLEEVVRLTAAHFDDFILDDFFFTDCRCSACVAAKGQRSFREYRLELMRRISERVVQSARQVHPSVRAIIKFPNWYPSYAFTGYNPRQQRQIFDQIHTGTETRNRHVTHQSLPRYLSYAILRYMENIAPGKNAGGWFDAFDCPTHRDYVEQGVLTLLAGAREITLFCFGHIEAKYLPVLGQTVSRMDATLDRLGHPLGLACYLPLDAWGEDFLPDFLGMIGLPMEPTPEVDARAQTVLLTEAATADGQIVEKMHRWLSAGKTVVTTAAFWRQASGLGGETFRQTGHFRKALRFGVDLYQCGFRHHIQSHGDALFQEIASPTNDAWTLVAGFDDTGAFPILIKQMWGDGALYVLNLPHPFYQMTRLPVPVLDALRQALCAGLPASLRGDAEVGLFLYDNGTAVVHSFADHHTHVRLVDRAGDLIAACALPPGEMEVLAWPQAPASGGRP